jgi:hypothetical protein
MESLYGQRTRRSVPSRVGESIAKLLSSTSTFTNDLVWKYLSVLHDKRITLESKTR